MTRRGVLSSIASASAAVLICTVGPAPTPAGGQAAPCEQPYSPVAATVAATYPAELELPEVDADPVPATPTAPPLTAFDSDGDGVDDTVTPGAGGVTISRGDGDVVLTVPGGAAATGIADMDGDGRDEIAVITGGATIYVVPGTVAAGTTPAADAGILLPFGAARAVYLPDGSDRLLVVRPEGNSIPDTLSEVHDGSAILALGPGGDASSLTPIVTVPGWAEWTADLGGPLLIISGRSGSTGTADDHVELFVVDGTDIVELTTEPRPFEPNYVSPFGPVAVLDGPDGTFVRLIQTHRGGGASYLWSLDDPCTVLDADDTDPPDPSPPSAPPAAPLPAEADFTG